MPNWNGRSPRHPWMSTLEEVIDILRAVSWLLIILGILALGLYIFYLKMQTCQQAFGLNIWQCLLLFGDRK